MKAEIRKLILQDRFETSPRGTNPSIHQSTNPILLIARDTQPPYVDNRLPSIASAAEGPMLVAGKPELREYKAVFVVGDVEVSQFSDEITVNCAPLV